MMRFSDVRDQRFSLPSATTGELHEFAICAVKSDQHGTLYTLTEVGTLRFTDEANS